MKQHLHFFGVVLPWIFAHDLKLSVTPFHFVFPLLFSSVSSAFSFLSFFFCFCLFIQSFSLLSCPFLSFSLSSLSRTLFPVPGYNVVLHACSICFMPLASNLFRLRTKTHQWTYCEHGFKPLSTSCLLVCVLNKALSSTSIHVDESTVTWCMKQRYQRVFHTIINFIRLLEIYTQ